MKIDNKYGYKVSYEENKKKKQYLLINKLDGALWEIENYKALQKYHTHITLPPNPIWHIDDVKTLREYEKLWAGCPFKEDFSKRRLK